ncbi:MAG: DUF4843 domain-containing protein [Bacteroidia bacterium]|nr:DUF4843 domain-containing protein [Bacteroidia bacterium]
MKTKYSLIILSVVAILLASCQKFAYDGEFSKDGFYESNNKVYFHFAEQSDTLTRYSFGTEWVEYTRHIVKVPVRISGLPANKALTFKVSVDTDESTAIANKHYTPFSGEFQVPADSVNGYMEVEVWRENLPADKMDSIRLVLRLESTSDLQTTFSQYTKAVITIDDYLEEPYFWVWYSYYWGPYSRAKYIKFLEYYDGDPKKFEATLAEGDFYGMQANFVKVYEFFKAHPEYNEVLPDFLFNPYN